MIGIISGMGGGIESEVLFYEVITRPLIKGIRKEFDQLQQEKLKKIIEEYESAPRHKKFLRRVCFYGPPFYETNLRYYIAKAYLDGTIEKIKEQERKIEQERKRKEEKKRLEEKIRNEWINKGRKVEFFPGNLQEYELLKGKKYQLIDTGEQEKELIYHPKEEELAIKAGKLNVDALIRCQTYGLEIPTMSLPQGTKMKKGLPVRRISKKQ